MTTRKETLMGKKDKVKEWRVGDTINVQMADEKESKEGKIESIDKVMTTQTKEKRQWASVLVPAVLAIDNCRHDILQRRQVNLLIYKIPKARTPIVEPKPTKAFKDAETSKPHPKRKKDHLAGPERSRSKYKCCGHPADLGHAEDCELLKGKK